jgi:hypothetical protein
MCWKRGEGEKKEFEEFEEYKGEGAWSQNPGVRMR